ncbi:MAG: putative immunity protein [Vampirovibrionia bacterium]
MTVSKIRIVDDLILRSKIVAIIKATEKEILLDYVQEIITVTNKEIDYQLLNEKVINEVVTSFHKWRNNEVNLKILRSQIFKLHSLARAETNEIIKTYYRFLAHALATAHVVDHLEVALDYLIKLVNLKTNNLSQESTHNRLLQIDLLNNIIESKQKV